LYRCIDILATDGHLPVWRVMRSENGPNVLVNAHQLPKYLYIYTKTGVAKFQRRLRKC